MKEIWKHIKGYKGFYEISNIGRVRSLTRKILRGGSMAIINGRILKPGLFGRKRKQYFGVVLCKNGVNWPVTVHRLVGEHFVPNPKRLGHLNHIDHNPLNNYYKNLKWVTNRENAVHGKRSRYPGITKVRYGYVAQIRVKNKNHYLGFFKSPVKASKAYGEAYKKITGLNP